MAIEALPQLLVGGGDGDGVIEDDETFQFTWHLSDTSGIGNSYVTINSSDYPGSSSGGGIYQATVGPLPATAALTAPRSAPRSKCSIASSMSNGFGRYSKAPL